MFPTDPVVNYVSGGPCRAYVDGYGVPFNPQDHLDYILAGLVTLTATVPPVPHVEPRWEDRPAGFRVCPPLHEDQEQGKGHYA